MKSILTICTTFLLLLASGCGSQQAEGIEAKKAKLKKLKTEQLQLNNQIKELETEIASLDPSSASNARIVPVTVSTLQKKQFKHYVKVQGEVEANQNIIVSPQTSGNITEILVREGQRVNKGQVLARIDDAVIQRNIEEIKTQLELAETLYQKQKKLWEQEIGTEVQYLTSKNQKETLERRLETLQEQADMAQVMAPISGTVDKIIPKIGEAIAPGAPFFQIVNNRDLHLKAEIAEAYIPYVKEGDSVKIEFPTLNKTIRTRISSVAQAIDPESRTFEIETQLPPDDNFKANMFGDIAINDRTFEETITIPINVIQRSETGSFVYIAEPSSDSTWVAKRKEIETGLSYDGKISVQDGLESGDKLIIAGYKDMSDGQLVTLSSSY